MEMCKAFSENGFDTTLCVPKFYHNEDGIFKNHNIEKTFRIKQISVPKIFIKGPLRGRCPIFAILSLNFLKKIKNTIFYSRDVWIFFLLTVILRSRCFYEAHQFRYKEFLQTFIYQFLVKLAMTTGKGTMICISSTLKQQFVSLGMDENNIHVAHDGVSLTKYSNNLSKEEARAIINVGNDYPIVVYTGSLMEGKGADILIKVGNKLKDVCFMIVGGNKDQIKNLKKDVKADNIIFIGHVLPKEIPVYQKAADILAMPNTKGSVIDDVTSPMKLFEYMAAERAIVATDIPSVSEILMHEYNALISPAGDDLRLGNNIKKLIANPNLSNLLISNAKKDLQKYTWDARVAYLEGVFSCANKTALNNFFTEAAAYNNNSQ